MVLAAFLTMSSAAYSAMEYVAPPVVAHNGTTTAAQSVLALTAPALEDDDVLLAQVAVAKDLASNIVICPPPGWTSLTRMDWQDRKMAHQIFSYRATEAESSKAHQWQLKATSCTGSAVTGKGITGGMLHYRGVDTIGTPVNSGATNSGSTATAPAVTTTEDGAMVVRFFTAFKNLTFNDTSPASRMYTQGSANNSSERTAAAYQRSQTTKGASGTFNVTLSTSSEWLATTVALQGAPVPVCAAASIAAQPVSDSATYGEDASFTVTGGGNPQPTVQWQSKATTAGADWANVASATSSTLNVVKPSTSQSGTQYRAVLTNQCNGAQTATSNAATLTVSPKAASVTPNAASKTYGDADPTLDGTLSGFLSSDGVSATYSRTTGETAGGYTISATLAPTEVLSNYDITYNTAGFTIDPKAASVTPNAASKTYGDADPTLDGTLSGFLSSDGVNATYSRTTGETAGGYTISATLAPTEVLSNYDITYNTADFTINRKAASVTPNAASKTYGDADPTLSGTLSGFLSSDGVTATYSRSGDDQVAGTKTISATLAPTEVLSNYDITYNTAVFTINRKAASVTPNAASKTYGDDDPALSGTLSGFLSSDGVTATYSRTAGETMGVYSISAALSPTGVLGNYDITYNTAQFSIGTPCGLLIGGTTRTAATGKTFVKYGTILTVRLDPAACSIPLGNRPLSLRVVPETNGPSDPTEAPAVSSGTMRMIGSHYTYKLDTNGMTVGTPFMIIVKDTTTSSWSAASTVAAALIETTR